MPLRTPCIIVNFKAYEASTGEKAVQLARICEEAAQQTGAEIAVAVQAADIFRVCSAVKIPVLAQHVDPVGFGKFTGMVLPESMRAAGACGSLLNHAERRLDNESLGKCISRAHDAGLITVVCAENADKAADAARFKPDFIAIEDPALISGKISIATANPAIITDTILKVNMVAHLPILCGAGVNTGEDVKKALELGTKGILMANAVVNAADPRKILLELAYALRQ